MNTQHTPGPWNVAQHDHGIVVCTESAKKSKHGASRYAAIGGFDRGDPEQLQEALANARLIAAAPDMLAALHGFVEKELTVGQRYTNEGQAMLDAIGKALGHNAEVKGAPLAERPL